METQEGMAIIREVLVEAERQELLEALKKVNWVEAKAANLLRLPRNSLRYRMRKFRIENRKGRVQHVYVS